MKPILELKGIGKQYRIGGDAKPYLSLRDSVVDLFKGNRDKDKGKFWALKDVSFDVYPGDTIGIIGRNGAGKSTLLKVLSKITPPTEGYIKARGRVASLLEVGTGFHPELTGRENVYLNGSILGLTRTEINKKFDEIVDFSGVERFLETPLKHYSSGMQLRLAFAVAAHLEPEILVVDEVLAVGDAAFQRKCLGKMDEVSKSGRTILFVSHNMGAVSSLCSRSVLLESGQVKGIDSTSEIIAQYFSNASNSPYAFNLDNTDNPYEDDKVKLVSGGVFDKNEKLNGSIEIGDKFGIILKYEIKESIEGRVVPNLHFYNSHGNCVFVCNAIEVEQSGTGTFEAICRLPGYFMNNGFHFVNVAMTTYYKNSYTVHFLFKDALSFDIKDVLHDNPMRYNYAGPIIGAIRPKLEFRVNEKK